MPTPVVSSRVIFSALLLCLFMTACAVTRSTFDVPISSVQPSSIKGYLKLVDVKDVRSFEAAPRNPAIPSLQNPAEIKDPKITSRAIARKRGGFGAAMADILLPEGRTVEQLVREAVTKAVADRGYSVVDQASPEFGKALPLRVEIQQFWAWFTPGFFLVSVEFEGIVRLNGPILLDSNEQVVRGYSIVKGLAASDTEWQQVMQQGIEDLIEKTKTRVKSAE